MATLMWLANINELDLQLTKVVLSQHFQAIYVLLDETLFEVLTESEDRDLGD